MKNHKKVQILLNCYWVFIERNIPGGVWMLHLTYLESAALSRKVDILTFLFLSNPLVVL